jgi:hypothetical protein
VTHEACPEKLRDPWGLELTGLGYQNDGVKENKYLYNGKEMIVDNDLQYYDDGARIDSLSRISGIRYWVGVELWIL